MKSLRHMALCAAALLFFTPAAKAAPEEHADSPVVIRSAYCQQVGEGAAVSADLFAFVSRESEWPEPLKISAGVPLKGKQEFLEAGALETVEESGRNVAYLLLVDHSNSMKAVSGYRNAVRFAGELARCCKDREGISYAVASFGREFQLEQGFTADADLFQEAVRQIEYGEMASDPAGAILAAVDYLNGCTRGAGELVNLILITDGIPEKTDADSLALENAAKQLDAAPSILVHTFGLSNQNREESAQGLDTLASMGLGVHAATPDTNAAGAARQVAEMVDGLYALQFSSGQRQAEQIWEVKLYFNGDSVASMRVPNLGQAGAGPLSDRGSEDGSGTETPETQEPPAGGDPSGGGEQNGLPEDGGQEDPSDGSTSAENAGTAGDGSSSDGEEEEKGVSLFWPAVGAAGLIILAGAGFLILRRRNSSEGPDTENEAVCVVLEVISGACATKERRFYLSDELTIGKSRKCEIVWKDSGMAPRSARIFLSNHAICIEDIGSSDGVYLGGMRLHNTNRLRSGDEIAIGSARFRFKF